MVRSMSLLSSHIFPFMCGMDLLYLVSLKKKVLLLCSLVSLPRSRFFGGALRDIQKTAAKETASETRARVKITPREKRLRVQVAWLAWGDFHARSRFSRSTIPEGKWATTRRL